MRRKEKEIASMEEIENIIISNNICRIALSDNNRPYILPMNYGYSNGHIYLHSAKEGKKLDIIKKNPEVCFEITDSIEIIKSGKVCDFGTRYRSIIGFGKIFEARDFNEKETGLKAIMERHAKSKEWEFADSILQKLTILRIDIESVTGKKSGF